MVPTPDKLSESLANALTNFSTGGDLPKLPHGKAAPHRSHILQAASELRLELALRGRSDPLPLLRPDLEGLDRLEVLDVLARECDLSSAEGWLLNDVSRRRELSRVAHTRLIELLEHRQAEDDIARALFLVFSASQPIDLNDMGVAQLRALLAIEPAVQGLSSAFPDSAELRRHFSYRARLDGFLRFSSGTFVGRQVELNELLGFIRSEGRPKTRIASLVIWGTGGIGKSTLIAAALATIMKEDNSHLIPVHLDFDRSDLAIENTIGLTLEVLRQIGVADSDADHRLKIVRDSLRDSINYSFENLPSKASEAIASTVLAGMRGSLSFLRNSRKRIVLVLDTFENVERSGTRALTRLRRWIEQLSLVSGAPQMRIVIAGRTDPAVNGVKGALSWPPHNTRKLEDLSAQDSCELLMSGGVPLSVADAIYRALGGNPLILILIRGMFEATKNLTDIEAIAADVADGRLDQQIIQGVLYDRFLKHVPSEDAREYAHPGLVLPYITPELIRHVLGPLKNETGMTTRRSEEIFEALSEASWLVHREGVRLSQRPDVRRLTLKLMMADPARSREVERVRLQAMLYHASSRTREDRAALAYHLLMQVREKEDLLLLDEINLSGTGAYIRKFADDLPDKARAFAEVLDFESGTGRNRRAVGARSIPAEQALLELPDDLWKSFMVGDEARSGEGDRLVDHGDPVTALDLWRRRPLGSKGSPPTFVLRALAETGDWNSSDADISELASELNRNVTKRDFLGSSYQDRLYWVLCYLLLSSPFLFARDNSDGRPLIAFLKRFCERRQRAATTRDIIPLVAVVEGLCEEQIVPDRYFESSSKYATCTRLHLQRGRWSGRAIQWHLELANIVALQKDFSQAFAASRQDVLRAGTQVVFQSLAANTTANMLKAIQADINALQGKPLAQVQKFFETTKRKVTVRTGRHERSDRALEVRLLRGSTPELHRCARQALVEALVEDKYGATPNRSAQERISAFASEAFKRLSIRPAEFNVRRFSSRAAADPHTTFLALVEFADRARVLESVLLIAQSYALDDSKIMRVVSTLRAWDWALARQSADWMAD